MEMRGRNGKWLRAGSQGTVGEARVIVMFKFSPRVEKCGDHCGIGSKDMSRSGRRSIDGKEGVIGGKLAANFFFLDVEEMSNMLDHLLVGESHLRAGRPIGRRRGDNVGCVASTVGRGQGAGWNEDGGRRAGHGDRGNG